MSITRPTLVNRPTHAPPVSLNRGTPHSQLPDPHPLVLPCHPSPRYTTDQVFTQVLVNSINSMSVIDGLWYVQIKGDYAGRVSGRVFDITNATSPLQMATTVRGN